MDQSQVKAYLNERKSIALVPISEGPDEQDYYLCPTCYSVIGTHDEDFSEHNHCCPECGQRLSWAEYREKWMQNRIRQLIDEGCLKVETKEDLLCCSLNCKEIRFVVPHSLVADKEQDIDRIVLVLIYPGAFGISRETMDRIRTVLWKEE